MNKSQYLALLSAAALFLALYLGFDTTPSRQKMVERSRSIQGESTGFETLLEDARAHLNAEQSAKVLELENRAAAAPGDSVRASALKDLSGWWYQQGQLALAGSIAGQVAELENTAAAWSVAGATFYHALGGEQDPKLRSYCGSQAVRAFESAVSLEPSQVEHRVNLALVYAENPPPDNPMKAVLLLRDLETQYPESPAVFNALGRLAIKTGQWERAVQRLEKAWALDPENPNTPCLLAKAYEGAGQANKATEFAVRCAGKQE
ncbi:MAG: tetratricopeptide repeat protein [Saprospirales bacterium]|nr:tetratricopeptide repeat protein [Saprospirales bacterium]